MTNLENEILRELYDHRTHYEIGQLETITGKDPVEIRAAMASLKDRHYVRERDDNYEISVDGIAYGQSRWV